MSEMTLEQAQEKLLQEAGRLDFKAVNLAARDKPVMAAQEQLVADALRIVLAALAEAQRHGQQSDDARYRLHGELERAEAKLAEAQELNARQAAANTLTQRLQDEETTEAQMRADEAQAREKKLREAASALVEEMQEIEASPDYKSVWTLAYIHGQPYKGRSWKAKRDRLIAVLALAAAKGKP